MLTISESNIAEAKVKENLPADGMFIKYYIFWLQVSIFYIIISMEVADCKYYLYRNEPDLYFWKSAHLLQVMKQLTAFYVIHDKIYPIIFLKYKMHSYDEWMLDAKHY